MVYMIFMKTTGIYDLQQILKAHLSLSPFTSSLPPALWHHLVANL